MLAPYFGNDERNSHVLPRRACLAADATLPATLGSGEAVGETAGETGQARPGDLLPLRYT